MRPDHHVLIGGALTVGLVAVMAAAFFELHKYSTSHTQVIIQP